MDNLKISFIGGGNMACSLIGGLLKNGWSGAQITVSDPDPASAERLLNLDSRLNVVRDNTKAVLESSVIVMAVKPQVLQAVVTEIRSELQSQQPLLISIAAGITSDSLDNWSGGGLPIVRCMPNTPAMVESGATGLFANQLASDEHRRIAETLLRAVGITVWLDDEQLIDAVTALSGSGPAYYFLVMEAMQDAAVSLGIPQKTAKLLTLETAFGAAKLALESPQEFSELRHNVTSKGGTTAAALAIFEQRGLREIFDEAMKSAADRSREMAKQLGTS